MGSHPLKIGFVIDDTVDKPDGVQQYVLTLGAWLSAQGHEVHYLAGESKRADIGRVYSLSKNVKVKFNGNWLTVPLPANNRRIRALLAREQYDILHVQMPYSPMLAHKVVRYAPAATAVIGTFHILPQTKLVQVATHALGIWLQSSLKRFDQVLAVSPAARIFAMRAFRLSDVRVSPNVVATRAFRDAKLLDKYQGDVPTIMFLGRLVPRKGCAVFLDALAELKAQHPNQAFRAVVCGKGPLEAALKAQAAQLGLTSQVAFAGFLSEKNKPRYVKSADIMVFPSNGGESFGYVLIEAMSAGHPVVLAGDNPGYRSVMEDRPEQLFDPYDAHQLASKMYGVLSDRAGRKATVAWQRQHVVRFDVAIVGPQLVAAYRNAIAKRLQSIATK